MNLYELVVMVEKLVELQRTCAVLIQDYFENCKVNRVISKLLTCHASTVTKEVNKIIMTNLMAGIEKNEPLTGISPFNWLFERSLDST